MAKNISKKSKRRVVLICIIAIGLILLLLVNMFSVWDQMLKISKDKDFYTKELKKLKEEEEYLKVEVEKLQDPDYVARYAREQYLYSKDGEFTIRIN